VSASPNTRPGLRPPQFGLRTLLWLVTACAVLLASSHWLELSPLAVSLLLLFAVAIALHVVGNCLGTRLRQIGDNPEIQKLDRDNSVRSPRPEDFAPATPLSVRQSLGWMIAVATLTGMITGGLGGGLWTAISSRGPISPFNIGVGVIAFSVLGGLAAFGVVALVQVLFGAIFQALRGTDRARPAPTRRSKTVVF
jgi:hypothetical protein